MIKIENFEVFNLEGAIRGMRNPLNSHHKSDSLYVLNEKYKYSKISTEDTPEGSNIEMTVYAKDMSDLRKPFVYSIGENDMKLCKNLIKAGPEHRKFLRQIFVSFDLTADLAFWKQFDTYKIGTVSNSESTMHTLSKNEITFDNFDFEEPSEEMTINAKAKDGNKIVKVEIECSEVQKMVIAFCEGLREKWNETKDPQYWRMLIKLLPEGWMQKRTITCNYETLYNIIDQRSNHKMSEWHVFVNYIFKNAPYAKEFFEGE